MLSFDGIIFNGINVENKEEPMPVLPNELADKVVVQGSNIFFDKKIRFNAIFNTWLYLVRSERFRFSLEERTLEEVANIRNESDSGRVHRLDGSLKILTEMRKIIGDATYYNASDIHFLVHPRYTNIHFRINGDLKHYIRITHEAGVDLIRSAIQGLSTVRSRSYVPLEFQDAQISGEMISEFGLDSIRIIRGPSYPEEQGGQFMIMRLQFFSDFERNRHGDMPILKYPDAPTLPSKLRSMGYTPLQEVTLKRIMQNKAGIVVICGPTGSGKTTTLFQCLQMMGKEFPQDRLITIEDPVENVMPWALQMAISNTGSSAEERGVQFSMRMQSILRMDPDLVLLGEIRNHEVANVAFEAAKTGHQVWATVHANDPFSVVSRIEDLNPASLSLRRICDHTFLRGLVAQRLVPTLCPDCSVPYMDYANAWLDKRMITALHSWCGASLQNARLRVVSADSEEPCPTCGGDGTTGRIAIAEIVSTDAELMKDFVEHGISEARLNYRKRNTTKDELPKDNSLMGNALLYFIVGKLDPRDIQVGLGEVIPLHSIGMGRKPRESDLTDIYT